MEVGLDKEQQVAVDCTESLFCSCGPGSGKTRILTEKARKLWSQGENILCLTFTRAAAKEMQLRVPGLPATTIHSYCCGRVGWKEEWGYGGLLYRFLMEKERDKFSWVLVDESQDLSEMELDVVLSMVDKKIFAVGDPYQSIYGFQGALGPDILLKLEKVGCEDYTLHNNYRSCPEVVSRLERIYRRNLVSKAVKDTSLTCILCRTNEDVFFVSKELKSRGIPHRIRLAEGLSAEREFNVVGPGNLCLRTIHQSKGQEFDKVVLFSWRPSEKGEETRVFYVAASRASKEFTEVGSIKELLEYLE